MNVCVFGCERSVHVTPKNDFVYAVLLCCLHNSYALCVQ